MRFSRAFSYGVVALLAVPACLAAEEKISASPIADALQMVSEDVRIYNDHLTILASPYMEGRVPGSKGMERAMEYVEYYFKQYGVEPAFPTTRTGSDGSEIVTPRSSFRQPFPLGGTTAVTNQSLSINVNGRTLTFRADEDYSVTGLGASGEVEAPMVFVGYAINEGPDGYSSFAEGDDLSGKIALALRFEPVDAEGRSRWSGNAGWSNRANFAAKMRALAARNPAGVIIINPPGTTDPRAGSLMTIEQTGGRGIEVPVMMMTIEAGQRLVQAADSSGRTLDDLRKLADEGRAIIDLNGKANMAATIERQSLMAENVGGLIPGKGDLADEYIVVGAHLDHIGMGYFGSRSGPGELHPGADDNASGSAAIMMMADKIKRAYDAMPADASARSILVIAFSGEESGLNGSRFYVNNPIVPIDDHVLMINFDMIGRIVNGRLSVTGYHTGEGMKEWLQPFFADTPLTVVQSDRMSGASDHTSFVNRQVPVLFGIIADFHSEYHTPRDVSSMINRVGAVDTLNLFTKITLAAATRPERFSFVSTSTAPRERQAQAAGPRVRFGIMPGYVENDEIGGVLIEDVTADGSADKAGIKAGDRLVRWDGQKIADIYGWMESLGKHSPGDKVMVGVLRDGTEISVEVELQGR